MKIGIKKIVEVEAKTLCLHLKVCDQCNFTIEDQDGAEILQHEDYVPQFFPGEHYGDYVIFNIDIETGQITNWKKPTSKDIQAIMKDDQ